MTLYENLLNFLELKKQLPNPGSFENLHRESRGVFPTQHSFDGAKIDLHSQHNQNFQTTHSFSWAAHQQPAAYHFGGVFADKNILLHGQIDQAGTLQARGHYNWIEIPQPEMTEQGPKAPPAPKTTSTSKIQAQLTRGPQNAVILEHEYISNDFAVSVKAQNANPFDRPTANSTWPSTTGVFTASYLQSISQTVSLGAEYTLQRPYPDVIEGATSFGLRYLKAN